jgi:hypothetical protein
MNPPDPVARHLRGRECKRGALIEPSWRTSPFWHHPCTPLAPRPRRWRATFEGSFGGSFEGIELARFRNQNEVAC